jgi:hypothetical protein
MSYTQAQLVALITATPVGGTATLQAGSYDDQTQVNITKNMTLDGGNVAKINRSGSTLSPMLNIEGSSITAVTLRNLKLFGNNIPSLGVRVRAKGVVFDGVEIKDTHKDTSLIRQWWEGIDANGVTGLVLRNSYIHNIQYSGIAAVNCPGVLVEYNVFEYCTQNYPSGGDVALQDNCHNMIVRYNTMKSSPSAPQNNDGLYAGQSSYPVTGALITHNTMIIYSDGNTGTYQPPAAYASSGVKIYGSGEISFNDIDWQNSLYTVGLALWGASQTVNVLYNALRRGKYGISAWGSGISNPHLLQGNLLDHNQIGVNLEQTGASVVANKFVGNGVNIQNPGNANIRTGNLYDTNWITGLRKLTTSANISAGRVFLQGFQLGANEVYYTEDGSASVSVAALAVAGYSIDHFLVNGASRTPDANGFIYVNISADTTIQAVYQGGGPTQYTLTIQAPSGSGSTNPATGGWSYSGGAQAQVTATPGSGYAFDHWVLDGANYSANPISITMNSNHTLQAFFVSAPAGYTYTMITPDGQGTVTPAPGTYSYADGVKVTATPTPAAGWRFDHWIFDGTTQSVSNPITLTMGDSYGINSSGNRSLKAYFVQTTPSTFTITYTSNPAVNATINGTVYPSGSMITFPQGTVVTITVPASA